MFRIRRCFVCWFSAGLKSRAVQSRIMKQQALASLLASALTAITRLPLRACLRWNHACVSGEYRAARLAASTYAQARYRLPHLPFPSPFFLPLLVWIVLTARPSSNGCGGKSRRRPKTTRTPGRGGGCFRSERWCGLSRLSRGEEWASFADRKGDRGRDLALYVARMNCGLSIPELAAFAGIEPAAASKALQRMRKRLRGDRKLKSILRKVSAEIGVREQ